MTINGKWTLPVVQNDNTKVVFVRCDDPGVSIYHAVQYNELTVSRDNGSGEAVLTTANVKVVIMNSGYYPPTPIGYGMVIKNAAGNNTFTSDTEPLVWDGRSVNVGRNPEDLVDTGIARPMIPWPLMRLCVATLKVAAGFIATTAAAIGLTAAPSNSGVLNQGEEYRPSGIHQIDGTRHRCRSW